MLSIREVCTNKRTLRRCFTEQEQWECNECDVYHSRSDVPLEKNPQRLIPCEGAYSRWASLLMWDKAKNMTSTSLWCISIRHKVNLCWLQICLYRSKGTETWMLLPWVGYSRMTDVPFSCAGVENSSIGRRTLQTFLVKTKCNKALKLGRCLKVNLACCV